MSSREALRGAALIRAAKAVFLDWDGCIMHGTRPLPGADAFLAEVRERAWILSNNSTELPEDFQAALRAVGVSLPLDRFVLAGHETIRYAATSLNGLRVHIIANARLRAFARASGIRVSAEDAEAVVLLRDTDFTYAKLSRAANLARRGVTLIVSNPDRTHPRDGDIVAPETGALLAAVMACAGDRRPPLVVGKPEAPLFHLALERAGVRPDEAVMIGDNPDTDVAGARACGIPAILLDPSYGLTLESLAAALIPSESRRARSAWT